jgi:hypothetical protein
MVQSPLARCRLPCPERRAAWRPREGTRWQCPRAAERRTRRWEGASAVRVSACVRACTRARTHRHTCTKTCGANANQSGQPLMETPRPSWGRTDLPTSEAGTAFRSSPRPDEARFESHARQLCASPILEPCVLLLLPTLPHLRTRS